jgi:hypothetical protein
VNAFRMTSSNLSFTTISCTSASVTLQAGIILLVVEYTGWLKSLYSPDDYSTKKCQKYFNPLPLLCKPLLHGQKDCVFFQRAFKCIGQQERFRVFRPAWDI